MATSSEYLDIDCNLIVELPLVFDGLTIEATIDDTSEEEIQPLADEEELIEVSHDIFIDAIVLQSVEHDLTIDCDIIPLSLYYIMIDCTIEGDYSTYFDIYARVEKEYSYSNFTIDCVIGGELSTYMDIDCRVLSTKIAYVDIDCEIDEQSRAMSYAYIL